ncbi:MULTISPECIES: bactofilin family protein [Paenibacillus]|uniref:hypothetical protein n=1 Tax=Paenibacillus TaxID=44249 RepID=UPI0022B887BC|nr:hypothetical protein [Paenibacillus caseinilyticus]MCZ8520295.1 hypothetical protein [Paenibacillus caseinilyticus]
MKNRMAALLFICFALFALLPVSSASAATNVQITGQGTLVIKGTFIGSTAEYVVINQSGQVVGNRAFSASGGTGTINGTVSNLPYGTYKIIVGGPALTLNNLQYYFQ